MIMICDAQPADFSKLTLLRHRLIRDDKIALMGKTFLRYYYFPVFYYSKDGILLVSKNEREEITGYIAGSLDFSRQVKYVNVRIALGLLIWSISRPHHIREAILLKTHRNTIKTNLTGYGRLSSLVVNDKFQGMGIGEELTTAFLNRLDKSHVNQCYLSCKNDNPPALMLYKKIGFQDRENFWTDNTHYILMTIDNIVSKNIL